MELHGIGASPLRKEDWPLLRGEGTFIADFKRPGMVHALVVRSPHAHARFSHIDGSAALQAPGVIDLITAAELPDRGRPIPTRMFKDESANRFLQKPLADGEVRYSGEPVAVLIAESRYLAEDAAELLSIDYEPLEVVLDPDLGTVAGHLVTNLRLSAEHVTHFGGAVDNLVSGQQAEVDGHEFNDGPQAANGRSYARSSNTSNRYYST